MPPAPKPPSPTQRLSNWFKEQRAMYAVQQNFEKQSKLLKAGFADQDAKERAINSNPALTADEKRRDFLDMKHNMGNDNPNFHEWNLLHVTTRDLITPLTSLPGNNKMGMKQIMESRGRVGTFFGKLFTGRIFSGHMKEATDLNLRWSSEAKTVRSESDELDALNERIETAKREAPTMSDAQKEVERLVRAGVDPKVAQKEVLREDRGTAPTKTAAAETEDVTLEDLEKQEQVARAVKAGADPKEAYKAVYEPEAAPVEHAAPVIAAPEMQQGGMGM